MWMAVWYMQMPQVGNQALSKISFAISQKRRVLGCRSIAGDYSPGGLAYHKLLHGTTPDHVTDRFTGCAWAA